MNLPQMVLCRSSHAPTNQGNLAMCVASATQKAEQRALVHATIDQSFSPKCGTASGVHTCNGPNDALQPSLCDKDLLLPSFHFYLVTASNWSDLSSNKTSLVATLTRKKINGAGKVVSKTKDWKEILLDGW